MDDTSALAIEIATTAAAARTKLDTARWAVTNAIASVVPIDDWIHRLDESSSYAAGSIAFVRSGVAMALRQTDPIAGRELKDAGWSVLVSDFFDFIVIPNREKLGWYRVSLIMTDGTTADFHIPGPGDASTPEEHATLVRRWFAQITETIVKPLWYGGSDSL